MSMFDGNDRYDQNPDDPGAGGAAPQSVSLYDAVANLYQSALGRAGSPDEINQWISGTGGDLSQIHQGILASDEYKQRTAGAGPTPNENPIVNPMIDGGGGGGTVTNPGPTGGSLIAPFTGSYAMPSPQALPTMGGAQTTIGGAPPFPNIPRFAGPSMQEAMADPGYQFVLDQGNKNLQNWAAAKGTLNDSSTAKALTDYGQGAAATQYGNVWDRAFNTYNTNLQSQYMDPWMAQFQTWQTGTVNPTLQNFQTGTAATQHANDVNWQDSWNSYLQKFRQFQDQRDSTFDKQFAVAGA